jgi:hypothetical protein
VNANPSFVETTPGGFFAGMLCSSVCVSALLVERIAGNALE